MNWISYKSYFFIFSTIHFFIINILNIISRLTHNKLIHSSIYLIYIPVFSFIFHAFQDFYKEIPDKRDTLFPFLILVLGSVFRQIIGIFISSVVNTIQSLPAGFSSNNNSFRSSMNLTIAGAWILALSIVTYSCIPIAQLIVIDGLVNQIKLTTKDNYERAVNTETSVDISQMTETEIVSGTDWWPSRYRKQN